MTASACSRCGSPARPGRLAVCPGCLLGGEDASPERLGPLVLEEELGRGGMGRVFRGRHVGLGRSVAVKFLAEELAQDEEARARFAREARALALLDHPHVVRVYDAGEEEGQPYLVLELVEGRPLSELLPLPLPEALRVAREVCEALAYAHARGVVHRDVTPGNVLLGPGGVVKVGDFGIARLVGPREAGAPLTSPRAVPGTPGYVAPEALAGAAPEPRMDVYAVGVLLHHMLTGEVPPPGGSRLEGAVGGVVRRALAVDPQARYPSAAALREELLRLEAQGGALALPPDEALWLRAVAVVLALAAALVFWALLLSFTPRVVQPGEVDPLTMLPTERLADGRLLVRARFATGPILGATAGVALALAAFGLLWRHWRREGLALHAPEVPVREARTVLAFGAGCSLLYALGQALQGLGVPRPSLMPLFGGALELAALYAACVAFLEVRRRGRPLLREWPLWAGVPLFLLPPVLELAGWLARWAP